MEKSGAINSINKMGKIGSIILTICKIFAIIVMVVMLVAGTIMLFIPNNLVTFRMSGKADIVIDIGQLGIDDKADLRTEVEDILMDEYNIGLDLNGNRYEAEGFMVIDDETVEVNTAAEAYVLTMRNMAMICYFAGFTMLLLVITLTYAGKLFKAFKVCESPFEENIVKAMKRMAIAMIPWSVLNTFSDSLINSMFSNQTHLVLAVDLGVLFVVFIIFMFAYIFKYGAILQQESDETL